MPLRIEKTVFISYRRTNSSWAQAVYQDLTTHGYDVFYDFQNINSGDFSRLIIENIRERAHFVLLLTPSVLERCDDPNDWLRKEIETAIDSKRNVIPLMLENFNFTDPTVVKNLTGKLALLKNYNGLRIHPDYFNEGMIRLRERYLNIPLDSVFHPIFPTVERITFEKKESKNKSSPTDKKELSLQEWLLQAKKNYYAKNYDEAIHCYSEAIHLTPTPFELYYARGIVHEEKGDIESAIQDYAQADRLKPDNFEIYKNSIEGHENNYHIDDIQEYYYDDVFKHESARLHWRRGVERYDEGNFDGAITDFSETLRINPDFPETYLRRGLAHRHKGDFEKAMADYHKAIDTESNNFTAHYERGLLYQSKGELNNALSDFTNSILIKPDYAPARTSLFSILKKLGREEEAKEHEQINLVLIQREDEYNRACFEAVRGKTDMALKLLKICFIKTPSAKNLAKQDPDFENIRNDPRFKELVGE